MNHRAATIIEIVSEAQDGIDTVSLHRALYARGKGYGMTTLYRDIRRLCSAGALTRRVVEEDGRPIIRYRVSAALGPVVGTGHGQSLAGLRLPGGSGALATGPVPVAEQASPYAARGGLTYGRCELAVTRRER